MSNDSVVDIEDLRRQVERLTKDREREEQAKAARDGLRDQMMEVKPTGFAATQIQVREQARQARVRAVEERDREYEKHLEATAAKRAKLRDRIAELEARIAAEYSRHQAAVDQYHAARAPLDADVRPLREELLAIEALPEIRPDYSASNKAWLESQRPVGWVPDPPARGRRGVVDLIRGGR